MRTSWRRHGAGEIGIVLQAFHLLPTMTALENVAVPLELAGIAEPFAVARAELEAVGLGHRLDHYPAQLSGGEQQRVAIARALGPRPALLFADEPTGNLDAATGEAVMDLLFERCDAAGATLLVITHEPALAARCGRVIELADGRIVSDRGAMNGWRLAWTIGRRELDWRFRGLRLLFFSLLLGVAALAAVGSLAAAMDRGLSQRGQSILGGDVEFTRSARPATAEELARFKSAGRVSHSIRMTSTAVTPSRSIPIQLKAVDGLYPLYGALRLTTDAPSRRRRPGPPGSIRRWQRGCPSDRASGSAPQPSASAG